MRLLEAIREEGVPCRFYQASSSEQYGKAVETPQNEQTPFNPRSPYAWAKVMAFHATRNYRQAYGMFAVNGILFNHESPRRGETFVTRKITRAVAAIACGRQDRLYLGNLDARRDWGFAGDYVEAMWRMMQADQPDDYVIATGESHSVREFCERAFAHVDLPLRWEGAGLKEQGLDRNGRVLVEIDPRYFRPTEVDTMQGDASKARRELGWQPSVGFQKLVEMMVEADLDAAARRDAADDHVMQSESKPTLLVISQVYVPDPASVGQHMADVAEAMAARGFEVRVLTSARGYENPQIKYPRREQRAGVDVRRLPWSSFGKKSLLHRIVGQAIFVLQVLLHGLFARRLDGILVSTSPPMASFAAVLISYVRRVPITYWLMDLNPDQAIALGKIGERNPLVWAIRWLNRRVFARAATVIVLDRYMAERVERQYRVAGRLEILPPWPHDESLADVPRNENPFVTEQQLARPICRDVQRQSQSGVAAIDAGRGGARTPRRSAIRVPVHRRRAGEARCGRSHRDAPAGEHPVAAVPAAGTDQIQPVGGGPACRDAGQRHGGDDSPLQDLRRDGGRPADLVRRPAPQPRCRHI